MRFHGDTHQITKTKHQIQIAKPASKIFEMQNERENGGGGRKANLIRVNAELQ